MGILTQLETDYDVDIVDEFLTHFGVMTMSLEPLIINLSKPDEFESNLNEIFRIFHNIKSSSGYLHIKELLNFTKLCEDILDDVRDKKTSKSVASEELIDWLLLASDELEMYRQDIENDSVYLHSFNPKLIKMPNKLIIPC